MKGLKRVKFAQIQEEITDNLDISDGAYRLFVYLKRHKLELYSPSYKELMEKRKLSKSTIRNYLKELEKENLILISYKKVFIRGQEVSVLQIDFLERPEYFLTEQQNQVMN